jgi:transcriptional regulator with XRE-family HTH domain
VTEDAPKTANSRLVRLAKAFHDRGFRHAFMSRQLKAFLAQQIRALRGDMRQEDFGKLLGKPQSVISRLEKQADRQISVQTLIDIAEKLDIGVIIRFVDFPTFLRYTNDYSDTALVPRPYEQTAIDSLVRQEDRRTAQHKVLQQLIGRLSEIRQTFDRPLVGAEAGVKQINLLLGEAIPIQSEKIIELSKPLQQRVDERIMRNVRQPQRHAA